MKTVRVNYNGFETDQLVDEAVYDAIYKIAQEETENSFNQFIAMQNESKRLDYEQGILDFADKLLNNKIVDRSVVRRIRYQMLKGE